jgi:hypothetical protein
MAGIPLVAEGCPTPYETEYDRVEQRHVRTTLEKGMRSTMQAFELLSVRAPPLEQGVSDSNGGVVLAHFCYHRRKSVPGVMSSPLTTTLETIQRSFTVFPMLF